MKAKSELMEHTMNDVLQYVQLSNKVHKAIAEVKAAEKQLRKRGKE